MCRFAAFTRYLLRRIFMREIKGRHNTIKLAKHLQNNSWIYIFIQSIYKCSFLPTSHVAPHVYVNETRFVWDDARDAQAEKKDTHFTFFLWPIHAFMMNPAVYTKLAAVNENEMAWTWMLDRAQWPGLLFSSGSPQWGWHKAIAGSFCWLRGGLNGGSSVSFSLLSS